MKNKIVTLMMFLLLCGCQSLMNFNANKPEEVVVVQEEIKDPNAAYVEKGEQGLLLHKVAIKAQGKDFVTYEYKDVRVDELAFMAVDYCKSQGAKSAYLRDIVLHQNHNRIATFDCKNLAKEQ